MIYDLAANHTQAFLLTAPVHGLTLGIITRYARLLRTRKARRPS